MVTALCYLVKQINVYVWESVIYWIYDHIRGHTKATSSLASSFSPWHIRRTRAHQKKSEKYLEYDRTAGAVKMKRREQL